MKNIFCLAISLILLFKLSAQELPNLKEQVSLNKVDDIVSTDQLTAFLVKSGDNYTLIDQSSKIQLGTIQLDFGSLALPGFGQFYLHKNSSFLISSGRAILEANVIENTVDTIFNAIQFPEFIVQFSKAPWNDSILMIATKIYTTDKKGNVNFFTTDAKNNAMYDDTKNCRLFLFNYHSKKIIKIVKINFAVTQFAFSKSKSQILAGTFDGTIQLIDSNLSIQQITQAFNAPIHSIIQQNNFIVATPHIGAKFIGTESAGKIAIFNTENKKTTTVTIPYDTPFVDVKSAIKPSPSNQIKKIFSYPQQQSILINYGFKKLVQLNLNQAEKNNYRIVANAVSFYCFNRDSSLLLASTQEQAGIFGVTGDLSLYDLQQQKFQPSFNKPLVKIEFKQLAKVFDQNGNYHYVGLRSDYGAKDSLIIFSSNKTEPSYLVAKNVEFNFNQNESTILLSNYNGKVLGSIHLENLRLNSYNFYLRTDKYSTSDNDSINSEIFTPILDTRKFTNKDLPYKIVDIIKINSNHFFTLGYNYNNNKTLYRIVFIDSLGNTIYKSSDFDAGSNQDKCMVSFTKKYYAFSYQLNKATFLEVWNIENKNKVFAINISANQSLDNYGFKKNTNEFWYGIFKNGYRDFEFFTVDITAAIKTPKRMHTNPDLKDLEEEKLNTQPIYFAAFEGYKPVEIFNNTLYKADKTAIDNLAFVYKNKAYLPSDFDAYFNRPDSVLIASGSINQAFNDLIFKLVEKRKKKINSIPLNTILENSPTCSITNKNSIQDFTKNNIQTLNIQASAKQNATIKAIHLLDNGVPVFGKNGLAVPSGNKSIEKTIEVTLVQNVNNIQCYVEDNNGLISASENLIIVADFTLSKESATHFIGIGINQFANADYNLSWSVKDIRDLALKLKSKYPNITIDTLFDSNVTKENILALKQKLLQLKEDDKVIVSYSGHGVLSKDFDYFLSTYSIDFLKPEEKGLAYDDLESLLDNIKPRKKLMLIDACHSGEVDKDEIAKIEASQKDLANNGVTTKSTIKVVKKEKQLGMANSFELMQSLFVNVGKGTGATIISAAGGMQYAQERGDLKNGVFTYSLIEAFNQNQTLKVSELKKKVGERVIQLTNGLQKPTSRNETNNYDWIVW